MELTFEETQSTGISKLIKNWASWRDEKTEPLAEMSFGVMGWTPYPWTPKSRLFVYFQGFRSIIIRLPDVAQTLAARRLHKRVMSSRTIQSIHVSEK